MKLRTTVLVVVTLTIAACRPDPTTPTISIPMPTLETRADSIAARVLEQSGGVEALAAMPYLRFDFVTGRSARGRRHLWNRMTDDYRVEYERGDTTVVVLFNTRTREGHAFKGGQPVAGDSTLVAGAYGAFINDMFWLMAPVKMLDPGVNRAWVADSSDAATDVLHLTFGEVGLTPGDQYWMWVDQATGLVRQWAYVLQGNPDAPPRAWEWTDYTELATPKGSVWLSARKQGPTSAIMTNGLEAPSEMTPDWFTDPMPRLN